EGRVLVPRGNEVEVFSGRIESGIEIIRARITDPGRLVGLEVVEPDTALLVRTGQDIGHPMPIRSPGVVLDFLERVLRDLYRLATGGGQDPQPMLIVGENQV